MLYVDTSVLLAWLLAEDRRPPDQLWSQSLVSSRLVTFETWSRLNLPGTPREARDAIESLLARIAQIEMIPEILSRARQPFPVVVRTLDALHLASAWWLMEQGIDLRLASYDERMRAAAAKLEIPLAVL